MRDCNPINQLPWQTWVKPSTVRLDLQRQAANNPVNKFRATNNGSVIAWFMMIFTTSDSIQRIKIFLAGILGWISPAGKFQKSLPTRIRWWFETLSIFTQNVWACMIQFDQPMFSKRAVQRFNHVQAPTSNGQITMMSKRLNQLTRIDKVHPGGKVKISHMTLQGGWELRRKRQLPIHKNSLPVIVVPIAPAPPSNRSVDTRTSCPHETGSFHKFGLLTRATKAEVWLSLKPTPLPTGARGISAVSTFAARRLLTRSILVHILTLYSSFGLLKSPKYSLKGPTCSWVSAASTFARNFILAMIVQGVWAGSLAHADAVDAALLLGAMQQHSILGRNWKKSSDWTPWTGLSQGTLANPFSPSFPFPSLRRSPLSFPLPVKWGAQNGPHICVPLWPYCTNGQVFHWLATGQVFHSSKSYFASYIHSPQYTIWIARACTANT